MKQGEKSIKGIWKFSQDANYEAGDFVVSGENIYQVKKDTGSSNLTPEEDTSGEYYKLYPGEMITSKEEYDQIISNVETSEDKYVSSKALNEILKSTYFGLDSDGIIDETVDVLSDGTIKTTSGIDIDSNSDSDVIDQLLVAPGFNNGMVKVSKDLESIKNYVKNPANDVLPPRESGKKWIKWNKDKCCKCWECVKCCKYIKKYTSSSESGITINPGDPSQGYEKFDDKTTDVTPEIWENAVKICPKKGALEYTDDLDVVGETYNDWEQKTGGIVQPSYDIIAYGAAPAIYSEWKMSGDPIFDQDSGEIGPVRRYVGKSLPFTEWPFGNDEIDSYNRNNSTYFFPSNINSSLSTSIRSYLTQYFGGSLPSSIGIGPGITFSYVSSEEISGENIVSDTEKIVNTQGKEVWVGGNYVNNENCVLYFVVFPDSSSIGSHTTEVVIGDVLAFLRDIYEMGSTTRHYNLDFLNYSSGSITVNNVPNIYKYCNSSRRGELYNILNSNNFLLGAIQSAECTATLTRTNSGGNPGNAIKFIKLLKEIEGTFGKEGENKISQSGITSSWEEYNRSDETKWIDTTTIDGDAIEYYNISDLPVNLSSWNSNLEGIETGPVGKMWDISNPLVYNGYIIKEGSMTVTWENNLDELEKIDKIYLVDRLSSNRLCIKIPEDFAKYFLKSTYSEPQLSEVIGMITRAYSQMGKTGAVDFFYDEHHSNPPSSLDLAKWIRSYLNNYFDIRCDYIFDIYPYANPNFCIDTTYLDDLEGYFNGDNLYYNSDNTHVAFTSGGESTKPMRISSSSSGAAQDPIDIWRIFDPDWFNYYANDAIENERDIVRANIITPSGFLERTNNSTAPSVYDVEETYFCALPSLVCRICYNDWATIKQELDPISGGATLIKLIPTQAARRVRNGGGWAISSTDNDYRIKNLISDTESDYSIEYSDGYFNSHYFEDSYASYAILKQYSYKDAGNNIQRVQELIDPSYGHVYIRSTNHRAWTSLAPGSDSEMIDLLRKMDRINEYISEHLSKKQTVYVPLPQTSWKEGSNGVYNRGGGSIYVKFEYNNSLYLSEEVVLGRNGQPVHTGNDDIYIKPTSPTSFMFCDSSGNPLSPETLNEIELIDVFEK